MSGPARTLTLYGITIDNANDGFITDQASQIAAIASDTGFPITTRVVFDEGTAGADWVSSVDALTPVCQVMGMLIDSEYIDTLNVTQYGDRATDFLGALGGVVSIWEVGNEVNGNWTGDPTDVAAKVLAAFNVFHGAGKPTAITVYYNPNGVDGAEPTPQEWTSTYLDSAVRNGVDYVLISYYEVDFDNYRPPASVVQSLVEDLHALYPNALVGFGEIGLDDYVASGTLTQAEDIMAYYYALDIPLAYFCAGYFWWYGGLDVLAGDQLMAGDFEPALDSIPEGDGGGTPYADAVLTDSPLLYWRLGETSGTDAVDASGNGNDGTYTSPDMHTAGLLADGNGAASIIDGSQTVDTPVGPTYLLSDYDAFTLEVIVESISFGSGSQYWGSIPGSPYFFVYDTGVVEFDTDSGSVTGPTLELDQAYHLCATYDGTTVKLYVNGTLVGSRDIAPPGINGDPGAQWSVGYVEGASGVEQDAAFYDHALSAARVLAHATAGGFSPLAIPTITELSPSNGFTTGGDTIIVTGTDLGAATAVTIGGFAVASFHVDSDTQITVVTPSISPADTYDLVVSTPDGDATASFTMVDPGTPLIFVVTPGIGFSGGGTTVHLVGSGLTGTTDVQFDGVSAASVVVVDDDHVTVVTPAHVAGTAALVLFAPGGTAESSFSFTDTSDLTTADCIAVTVGSFVADGATPDGNGIVYEVESLTGWYDTPPVRSETMEAFPTGEFPTVYRENGRRVGLVITAHAPSKTDALGGVLCWTGIAAVKAAFDALYLPVTMAVADSLGTSSGRVRLASPTRATIVGDTVMARLTLSLIAPDPRLT